ncbi:MAG TPA: hypothetical protein VIK52_07330 [Opitutaceae bacterium]
MRLTASLLVLSFGISVEGNSQVLPHTTLDLDNWKLTGASAVTPNGTAVTLPAGAQLSRSFDQGESVTARLRFDATLSEGPTDVVSLQFGRSTLAFARSGNLGVVFISEEERLAQEPLLVVELGSIEEARVPVSLEALAGATGARIRIEVAGESAKWESRGSDRGALEFALSAGGTAPVKISEFEFIVDRTTAAVAEDLAVVSFASRYAEIAGATRSDSNGAGETASARASSGIPRPVIVAQAAPASVETRNGGPPAVSTLEVFTPSAVPRGRPPGTPADSHARLTNPDSDEQETLQ